MQYIRYNKPSKRTAKLMKRRHQFLYNNHGGLVEGDRDTTLPNDFSPSATPVAITAGKGTESSAKAYISITLLGKVTMELNAPGGVSRAVPLHLNSKTIQLLAAIAWMRGAMIQRDVLIEAIWGQEEEEATSEKLRWLCESARKALRAATRQAVEQLNSEWGKVLLDDPKLDLFECRNQMWRLSPYCKVIDLEAVEEQNRIIMEAKKRGELTNSVPDYVKDACESLILAYSGDFLATLLRLYPLDEKARANAWLREPITYYRDCFLRAIWYAAEYELQTGQRIIEKHLVDNIESRHTQGKCWGRAGELYEMYALHACNNRFDTKLLFKELSNRGDGERVVMSERALRRCIILYTKLGSPHLVDEVFSAYFDQMKDVSDGNWEPSEETLREVQAARKLAAAYRLEG